MKKKYQSLTTPDEMMDISCYLVDMLFYLNGVREPYFWRNPEHKGKFATEIKAVRRFLKTYSIELIEAVMRKQKLKTFAKYGLIIYHLKNQTILDKNKKNHENVKLVPESDTSDYRQVVVKKSPKTLFSKLNKLKHGEDNAKKEKGRKAQV